MQNRYMILAFFILCANALVVAQEIDYTQSVNWWAHPETADNADFVPDGGFENRQDSARADVFYIHPTTYYRGFSPNAELNNSSVERLTKVVILNQATVFNGCCRVFAPKYRQARLSEFMREKDTSQVVAFDLAYEDVKQAFEAYLAHWNNDRPIVIAGHSQGSYIAQRLLADYFERKPLSKLLVAAYIPGYPLPASSFESQFTQIKPSESPVETGCIVTWRTISDKASTNLEPRLLVWQNGQHYRTGEFDSMICTNPLSWYSNNDVVPNDSNHGSLRTAIRPGHFPEPESGICGAQVSGGWLIVSDLRDRSFNNTGGNYHIYDYALYWVSLRTNVALRIEEYLKQN